MKHNLLCAMLFLYKENKKQLCLLIKKDKLNFCKKKPSQKTILERVSNNDKYTQR